MTLLPHHMVTVSIGSSVSIRVLAFFWGDSLQLHQILTEVRDPENIRPCSEWAENWVLKLPLDIKTNCDYFHYLDQTVTIHSLNDLDLELAPVQNKIKHKKVGYIPCFILKREGQLNRKGGREEKFQSFIQSLIKYLLNTYKCAHYTNLSTFL